MPRPQTQVRRVHESDGFYEEEIGVVSRRKLANGTVAIDNVLAVIGEKREQFYQRPGTHDANAIGRELAVAIVERLIASGLLTP